MQNPETNRIEPLTISDEQREMELSGRISQLGDKLSLLKMGPGGKAKARMAQHEIDLLTAKRNSLLVRPDGSPIPQHAIIFRVGELITLKDYTYRVAHMNEAMLILEPVKLTEIGSG